MIPTAQTISHLVWSAGATDSHGNPVDEWAEPVDRDVYYYGPPSTTPDAEPGGTQVIEGIEFAAPTFAVDPRDRFEVGGVIYEVVGEARVWDNGPFGYAPGMTVRLKRVQGGR